MMAMARVLVAALVMCMWGSVAYGQANDDTLNYRPIIGILAQEPGRSMRKALGNDTYSSYIAASYVKFYEGAGARVVPIMINQPDAYYDSLLPSLNGFVFPGGSASITSKSGYGRAGQRIYDYLLARAAEGQLVPLNAICLGFEMLMYLAANNTNPLTRCKASNRADPLLLQQGWNDSLILGSAREEVMDTLTNTFSTSNFHKYCVTPMTFEELGLGNDYLLLSTSKDDNGVEYVSTVEHRELPFIGFQWHPEKNLYEWGFDSIPHSRGAVEASQHMANVFVEEARNNNNGFPSEEEEISHLIYNHQPIYVATMYKSSFQQIYLFK